MASHGVSWVPGAYVRFGDLDFIVTMEGELPHTLMVSTYSHTHHELAQDRHERGNAAHAI